MTTPENVVKAGRREWLGLIVLTLPALIAGIDFTVLHLAVPKLSEDLNPSSSELLWIMDSYGFMVAGFLITMGTIGDRVGRRLLLLVGTVLFCALSFAAFLVDSSLSLIIVRALLGVAGATLAPSTAALIRTMFQDEKERLVAISVWAVGWFGGIALGPVVGGLVIEWQSWEWVFLIGVPFLIPTLIFGPLLLPEIRSEGADKIDMPSVILSILGVISVIYGLKHTAEDGFDGEGIGTFLIGLALVAIFVRRQGRLADPLLDLPLLRNPRVAGALSTQTIVVIALGGSQFFIGQHLQLVNGHSALEAGLWLLIPTFVGICAIMTGPEFCKVFHPAYVVAGSCLASGAGLLLLVGVVATDSPVLVLIGYGLVWSGAGPMFAICADLIIGSAPEERAGRASALSETGNEFGLALGIGLISTAGIALYRRQIDIPDGVAAAQADDAKDNLGSASNVADELPEEIGARLLESGQEAYMDGFALAAGLGGALCLLGAVVAVTLLRGIEWEPAAKPEPEATAQSEV